MSTGGDDRLATRLRWLDSGESFFAGPDSCPP